MLSIPADFSFDNGSNSLTICKILYIVNITFWTLPSIPTILMEVTYYYLINIYESNKLYAKLIFTKEKAGNAKQ